MNIQSTFRIRAVTKLAAAVMVVMGMSSVAARADDLALSCSGSHFRHKRTFPVNETVTLRASGTNPIMVGFPDAADPVESKTISSGPITTVLRAGDLTLQYFKVTGQLFVIHDDGRLTRLACKPT